MIPKQKRKEMILVKLWRNIIHPQVEDVVTDEIEEEVEDATFEL